MQIFTDARCLTYEAPGHPERVFRVRETDRLLRERYPDWEWPRFGSAVDEDLLRAHSPAHLRRLEVPEDFDGDTAYHDGISGIARLACGGALAATKAALSGEKAFSLMRPPGHHAERERAMGFCYLNHVAVCALWALAKGIGKVAVWDFDAHHGNGTEAILKGVKGALYVSAHQVPCYPGTGLASEGNCLNFPVAPLTPAESHMSILEDSWKALLDFDPELVLVSAGFDAYEHDPITQMSLRMNDFRTLGHWLAASGTPAAALLEGGYSEDLPKLVEAFLAGWNE
ncbi:histone deacetylase family protein [Pelagicoccus mobilis]|uniref:Histone deacetylase n=1 Tax=Pelagicoccus mobilis TaxID=415221 RepID=A0A934VQB7_9BACT|nr:histone deacetylase [Pelagicoccus mobilis]MBK1878182.1 histone deacetylase [Pelagicoccus mobilis]